MNIVDVILSNVRRYPEKPALICGETRLTYKEFNERCNRLANSFLSLGVGENEHFSLLSKNCHIHFELFFAAAKAGTVFVPLNYRLSPRELIYIINDSESKCLFFAKEYLPVVESIRNDLKEVKNYVCIDGSIEGYHFYEDVLKNSDSKEPDSSFIKEEDIVAIFYTSGTTGYPKGAMISHKNRVSDMINQVTDNEYIEPEDIHLNVGPLYHIGALSQSQGHIYRGCTVVILKEFDPKRIYELIEKEKINSFWAAPTMIQMLLDYPDKDKYDLSSVKTITYAGSPIPIELLKRAINFFGANKLIQFFGMTETGPQISHLRRRDHVSEGTEKQLKRLRSVGIECQNVHVRIVDDNDQDVPTGQIGEILVKSDGVTSGYWKKPEDTKKALKDGWFHTGDMGYLDEDRYLYIVDRKKDMIISGGENVYSAEVENVLCMHPAVSEAAVIGVPHEKWVETVKAIVVLKPGASATEDEIIEFCKRNLASYKKPTSVEFVDELPKTASGKVLKRELRERFGGRR